ncbi:MAG: hypothetical protein HY901_05250 [Deltaproteobacteria bacterium]|nr:hypothetical protein [Deltaproteobacteria bacterium]
MLRLVLATLILVNLGGLGACASSTPSGEDAGSSGFFDATTTIPDTGKVEPADASSLLDAATPAPGEDASTPVSEDAGADAGPVALRPAKVDLLIVVDNSRAMQDHEQVLANSVGALVRSLVNPHCLDATGASVTPQPSSGQEACPSGSSRRFAAIADLHLGVITTSLGGHGSDSCPASEPFSCPDGSTNTSQDDHGHLIARTSPCDGAAIPTYLGQGFLAWDPQARLTPPGSADQSAFEETARQLVLGAGHAGCDFPSQLESWYRFLVDPEPYASLAVGASGRAEPQGIDEVLLEQRASFLRPDSLLLVAVASDSNDCSVRESGQYFLALQSRMPGNPNVPFHLPRARSECASVPNDECCRSCGQQPGDCPADPNCAQGALPEKDDHLALRCFDQKRRFGIDFLYPVDRYVEALSSPMVPNRAGELVPNPLFASATAGGPVRDPSLVVLAGIVGVPWQDVARSPADLSLGYRDHQELEEPRVMGRSTWEGIVGDPASSSMPLDPHMIESSSPRSGTNPFTGDALAPPTSQPGTDPINGHEYTPGLKDGVVVAPDDLEYACIFELPQSRDCAVVLTGDCRCAEPTNDNPLCVEPPGTPGARTLQTHAAAYPALRQLSLLRHLGAQGVVSSICPAQQDDPSRADYAYLPAVQAMSDRVASRLAPPP